MTTKPMVRDRAAERADAFRALADRHLDGAYRLALAILGEPAEAQDATQDAFVLAWRNWGSLRDPAKFERWFDRIVVNTCRSRLRSAARRRAEDLSDELAISAPGSHDAFHERDALEAALQRLSPDHRLVVALRFYRDLTVDEIAARVGAPPGTVKSRLHHALRQLEQFLDEAEAAEVLA